MATWGNTITSSGNGREIMNTKNIFKLCVIGSLGMATLGLTLVFNPAPAAAHGERSQEPFLHAYCPVVRHTMDSAKNLRQ